jgi:UPF0755 protein
MKKRTRRRIPKKLFAALAVTAVIVLVGAVALVQHAYSDGLKPVSANQKSISVTIPLDTSVRKIGQILHDSGLIRSQWAFERYVRNHNMTELIQAGTYDLRPSQDVREIATILTQGKVATGLVTILPAQRLDQIRSALINYGFTSTEVDDALNPALYKDHPALVDKPTGASLEGYLYPESFQKDTQTSAQDIIRQSLDQMQSHLTPAVRAGLVSQGLTVHQGVILASIVEKEVSKDTDRPIVAQVFLKRLRENIELGSDITAFYGSIIAGKTPSVTYDSAYNTHYHKGLPPGPVSNVSSESLEAVAKPAATDWLFFVSGDDGVTYFSHTLEEHQALTKDHCKKLCEAP